MSVKIDYREVMSRIKDDVDYVAEEAYNKGYEQAKLIWSSKTNEESYQRGLSEGNDIGYKDGVKDGRNEAWETAKKIALMDTETSENVTGYFGLFCIMDNLTASEAIEKLKAYEEKQSDKIKVGDEVKHDRGWTAVVTQVDESGLSCVDKFGAVASYSDISRFSKTDRHFDIDKILEGMRYDD